MCIFYWTFPSLFYFVLFTFALIFQIIVLSFANIGIQTNKRCLGWIYSSFRWWIVENLIRIENEFWRWEASLSVCLFSYAFSIIELIMSCDTMAATGYSSNFFHTYFFGFYCYIRGKCDIILKIFHLNSAFYLDFCYIYDFKSQSFVCLSVGKFCEKINWNVCSKLFHNASN